MTHPDQVLRKFSISSKWGENQSPEHGVLSKEVFISVTVSWFCIIFISMSKLDYVKSLHKNYLCGCGFVKEAAICHNNDILMTTNEWVVPRGKQLYVCFNSCSLNWFETGEASHQSRSATILITCINGCVTCSTHRWNAKRRCTSGQRSVIIWHFTTIVASIIIYVDCLQR